MFKTYSQIKINFKAKSVGQLMYGGAVPSNHRTLKIGSCKLHILKPNYSCH